MITRYLVVSLVFALSLSAQRGPATPPAKTLVVNGQNAPGAVIQINGRTYVDLLALAQITNAAVTLQPDRVTLVLPAVGAPAAGGPANLSNQGLSKDFARTALAHLADLREWRSAVATTIRFGVQETPSVSSWLQENRARAEESLRMASVTSSTPSDKNALQLLQREFATTQEWDNNAAAARRALNAAQTVDPNALANDPLLTKITECGRFLNTMLTSGVFSDNPSCR